MEKKNETVQGSVKPCALSESSSSMEAQTILVIFYDPQEVMDVTPETTDEEIKVWCFRVRRYQSAAMALMAYAETPCAWSTLKSKSDDIDAFINEAYEHIKAYDVEWLEQNFV